MRRSSVPPQADAAPAHVFLVVRLVVDQHRQVQYGEVVDGGARSWGQFRDWGGLIRSLQADLAHLPSPADADQR